MACLVVECSLLLMVARELMACLVVECSLLLMVARHLMFDRQKVRPDVKQKFIRSPCNQRSDGCLHISVAGNVAVSDVSVAVDSVSLEQSQLVPVEKVKPGQEFLPCWMAHLKADFSLQVLCHLMTGPGFVCRAALLLLLL